MQRPEGQRESGARSSDSALNMPTGLEPLVGPSSVPKPKGVRSLSAPKLKPCPSGSPVQSPRSQLLQHCPLWQLPGWPERLGHPMPSESTSAEVAPRRLPGLCRGSGSGGEAELGGPSLSGQLQESCLCPPTVPTIMEGSPWDHEPSVSGCLDLARVWGRQGSVNPLLLRHLIILCRSRKGLRALGSISSGTDT